MTQYEIDGCTVTFTEYGDKVALSVRGGKDAIVFHTGNTPMAPTYENAVEAVKIYKEFVKDIHEADAT